MNLNDIKKIYFVGIGGIGMSALARYFNFKGVEVHGYDKTTTDLTRALEKEGMKIHYEEDVEAIPGAIDLVVYTPAIPSSHAELVYFRENGFPIKKRAEVLGIISRSQKVVAVAGTHGKTTTTSMLTHLLQASGVSCTAFLGGIAQNFGSNFVFGESDWVVVEADEYDRSFLHLTPALASIMSMDADHLDIYGDQKSLHETGFRAFARQVRPEGKVWVQKDWVDVLQDLPGVHAFGIDEGVARAENIVVKEGFFGFDYFNGDIEIKGLQLPMPGRHNVENATAAITLALEIGAAPEKIRQALKSFKGIWRRFDFVLKSEEIVLVDDYAHHPSELKAVIEAAREFYPNKKIAAVFQPHLFSRTRDFLEGFAGALDELDEAVLLDIYPARERPIRGVSSSLILERMENPNKKLVSNEELLQWAKETKLEVLLMLGAGDIDRLVKPVKDILEDKLKTA